MRSTRTIPILLLTVVAGAMLAGGPAVADPYPPGPAPGGVSNPAVTAGESVTFSGSGYNAYEVVTINVSYASMAALRFGPFTPSGGIGTTDNAPNARPLDVQAYAPLPHALTLTTTADASGNWSIAVPLTQAGTATLTAVGNMGHSTTQTVTVLAPAPSPSPSPSASPSVSVAPSASPSVSAAPSASPEPSLSATPSPSAVPSTPPHVSDDTVSDGGKVTFTGSGYNPYEAITITVSYNATAAERLNPFQSRRQTVTANTEAWLTDATEHGRTLDVEAYLPPPRAKALHTNADGNGNFSITVSLTEVGTAALHAVGAVSGHTTDANVTVTANTSSSGSLAVTGDDGETLATVIASGGGALGLGALLVWLAARRRRIRTGA